MSYFDSAKQVILSNGQVSTGQVYLKLERESLEVLITPRAMGDIFILAQERRERVGQRMLHGLVQAIQAEIDSRFTHDRASEHIFFNVKIEENKDDHVLDFQIQAFRHKDKLSVEVETGGAWESEQATPGEVTLYNDDLKRPSFKKATFVTGFDKDVEGHVKWTIKTLQYWYKGETIVAENIDEHPVAYIVLADMEVPDIKIDMSSNQTKNILTVMEQLERDGKVLRQNLRFIRGIGEAYNLEGTYRYGRE